MTQWPKKLRALVAHHKVGAMIGSFFTVAAAISGAWALFSSTPAIQFIQAQFPSWSVLEAKIPILTDKEIKVIGFGISAVLMAALFFERRTSRMLRLKREDNRTDNPTPHQVSTQVPSTPTPVTSLYNQPGVILTVEVNNPYSDVSGTMLMRCVSCNQLFRTTGMNLIFLSENPTETVNCPYCGNEQLVQPIVS